MRIAYLLLLLVLLACGNSDSSPAAPPDSNDRPNIIVVFVDDMGYGDLGCYGSPTIRTPHLDSMAAEGTRFTSWYAGASVCTPSRAALLTGRYPIRNAPNNFGPGSLDGLPLDEITLANLLKEQDYATFAVGKWHLGHQPEYLPTSRGFDYFYGIPYSNDMMLPWCCPGLTEEDVVQLYENGEPIADIGADQEGMTLDFVDKSLELIRENAERPFFLYLAHPMPHLPVSTTEEFRGRSTGGLYGDVVETIDYGMGQIFDLLEELAIEKNTLVVFTSDNGPWHNLPDRMLAGGVERWHTGSTGPLRGAKNTSYEGGFRVPAIVRWPGRVVGGRTVQLPVSSLDLLPTLVGLAGGQPPTERPIDGQDIMPLLAGGKEPVTDTFGYFRGKRLEAVRGGPWKLRSTEGSGIELFHLLQDPSEKYNRAESDPGQVAILRELMQRLAGETGAELTLP